MSCYEDDCRVHEQLNIEQRRRRCWRLWWRWWWWWCLPPPVLHQSLLGGEKAFFCRKSLLTTQEWWPSRGHRANCNKSFAENFERENHFSSNISVSVFECLPTKSKAFGGILRSINEIASFRPPTFASANSPHITSFSMSNQLMKFCLYSFETTKSYAGPTLDRRARIQFGAGTFWRKTI